MLRDARYAAGMHDPLIEFATVAPVPLHPAVLAARPYLARTVADLLAVPDDVLDAHWDWRHVETGDVELRYGFYRIHECLEAAITAIETGRSAGGGEPIGPAVPPLAALAAARWGLHGVLAPLADADWDADPGGGEWTIRRTLAHVIGSQRSYGWYNAWFLREGVVGRAVARPSEDRFPPEPTEDEDAAGTPAEVLARLDALVDANAVASAALSDSAMGVSARWSGVPVTIDFRLGRYGSHIREHTVQVDKTLAMLGRAPTEVERLVRLVLETYGRLEDALVGRSPAELDRRLPDGRCAAEHLTAAVDEVATTASTVRGDAGG
jgi:DinB superfamily